MGKGNPFISTFKGKVGNIVGFKLTNSNNKVTQGVRVYQPIVSNPKTTAQADQRMTVANCSIFYSLFQEILDHSFEGYKEGAECQHRFMKLNIGAKTPPYLLKGNKSLTPGRYCISEGSLVDTPAQWVEVTNQSSTLYGKKSPTVDSIILTDENKYSLSAFLADNPALKEGDQLTYVMFFHNLNGLKRTFYYKLWRGWLQEFDYSLSPSQKAINAFNGAQLKGLVVEPSTFDGLTFNVSSNDVYPCACALIVSRYSGTKWLRNNTSLVLTQELAEELYSTDNYNIAIDSYKSAESNAATRSDLYLNNNGSTTLVRMTVFITVNGNKTLRLLSAVDQRDTKYLFADNAGNVMGEDYRPIVKTEGENPVYYKVADFPNQNYITGFASVPKLPVTVPLANINLR